MTTPPQDKTPQDDTPDTRWLDPEEFRRGVFGLTISDDEMPAVGHLIRKAEARLTARIPQLQQRIDAKLLSVELVKGVVEDMVLGTVRNPEGLASDGAGGVTSSYFRNAASGEVHMTREHIDLLMPTQMAFGSFRVGVPSWRLP